MKRKCDHQCKKHAWMITIIYKICLLYLKINPFLKKGDSRLSKI